jgi:hypothetical protein
MRRGSTGSGRSRRRRSSRTAARSTSAGRAGADKAPGRAVSHHEHRPFENHACSRPRRPVPRVLRLDDTPHGTLTTLPHDTPDGTRAGSPCPTPQHRDQQFFAPCSAVTRHPRPAERTRTIVSVGDAGSGGDVRVRPLLSARKNTASMTASSASAWSRGGGFRFLSDGVHTDRAIIVHSPRPDTTDKPLSKSETWRSRLRLRATSVSLRPRL